MTALRWVALSGALAWAGAGARSPYDALGGAVLVSVTVWLTAAPVGRRQPRSNPRRPYLLHTLVRGASRRLPTEPGGGQWSAGRSLGSAGPWGELAVVGVVVAFTGGWASPFTPMLAVPVVSAGLDAGLVPSLMVAGIGALGVTAGSLGLTLAGIQVSSWRPGAGWVLELVLLALLGAHSRRLAKDAAATRADAVTRLDRLTRANDLLAELRRVAEDLPGTLALPEVVATTMDRLRELVDPDAAALLLRGQAGSRGDRWTVAAAVGVRLAAVLTDAELPAALLAADRAGVETDLVPGRPGLAPTTTAAVYVPLMAGDLRLGLLAVEWDDGSVSIAGRSGSWRRSSARGTIAANPAGSSWAGRARERQVVRTIAEQAAVAIDNARLFAALRCSGAEQERHRIARNLHDDVGQDLACLALTLDQVWIGLGRSQDEELRSEVDSLRREARRIIGHVRETMADLRTDVTLERDLAETLHRFGSRVTARSGMAVSVDAGPGRLPLPREREVWRIAQEAIVNAERHAQAGRVDVHWWPGPGPALLEVRDDGVGLDGGGPAGTQGGGLVAMGERAAALGAVLDIEPDPSGGTVVRCRLG